MKPTLNNCALQAAQLKAEYKDWPLEA